MRDSTIGAIPGAHVAEDHERRCAVLPALADVGAMRLLADGMQVERPHQLLEAQIVGAAGCFHFQPAGLPLREWLDAVASQDLIKRF